MEGLGDQLTGSTVLMEGLGDQFLGFKGFLDFVRDTSFIVADSDKIESTKGLPVFVGSIVEKRV